MCIGCLNLFMVTHNCRIPSKCKLLGTGLVHGIAGKSNRFSIQGELCVLRMIKQSLFWPLSFVLMIPPFLCPEQLATERAFQGASAEITSKP